MSERRDRLVELAGIDRVTAASFTERSGYSSDQYYLWFGRGSRRSAPSVKQLAVICAAFDWSPNYIFFGILPLRLSASKKLSWDSQVKQVIRKLDVIMLNLGIQPEIHETEDQER